MVVKIPKVGITLEPVKDNGLSFYQVVSDKHLKLIRELFSKIKLKDTSLLTVPDLIEFQNIKEAVEIISNNSCQYSDKVLYLHNLELYYDNELIPEFELSLYSRDGELRWGAKGQPFHGQPYFESWVEETLEVLINNL